MLFVVFRFLGVHQNTKKLKVVVCENITTVPNMGIIRITIPKEKTETLSCYDSGIYTIGYFDLDNCIEIMRGRWNAVTQLYNRPDSIDDGGEEPPCGGCTIDWGY